MRAAIVWNPATAPDRDQLAGELQRRCDGAQLTWLETSQDDPGYGQAHRAVEAGSDIVFVAGGDGTVAACAGALLGTGVPMALLPTGTGNLLARNLDIPLDLSDAVDLAFSGTRCSIDVLQAGGRTFVVMAGLGFDATMIRETGARAKGTKGWPAYVAGGLRALRRTPRVCYQVTVDDQQPQRFTGIGVVVGNVGRLQGGVALLPHADPADGILDVIVLQPGSRLGAARLAWDILRGRPAAGRRATVLSGERVAVSAARAVPAEFDGDDAPPSDSLTVKVLPGALTVCAAPRRPPDAVDGGSFARPAPPGPPASRSPA